MRYNIFNLIHKGLRASLYHTALQLQQTDFTIEGEREEALNRVREIIMLFEGHAEKEDAYILPAIGAYEPSVVVTFEAEHEEDHLLGLQLNDCIEKTAASESLLEKIVAGRELNEAFIAFMVFNLNHMAKEEDILNKLLWRYYADDEIQKIAASISQGVQPWIQDFYAKWMLRGINTSETIKWVKAIRNSAPEIVYQTLMQKAKLELPANKFSKLEFAVSRNLQLVN